MKLYRYLTKLEYAQVYINGGEIPIFPARSYLADERSGIFTPDEVLQQNLVNAPIEAIHALGKISGYARIKFTNCSMTFADSNFTNVHYNRNEEDSLILCFATKLDKKLAEKLEKCICVEILNIDLLISEITKQLGVQPESGHCAYTEFDDRNHFLKSIEDSWQEEYRIVWKGLKDKVVVSIPSGIGKDVTDQL
jgi:hypothetical protein